MKRGLEMPFWGVLFSVFFLLSVSCRRQTDTCHLSVDIQWNFAGRTVVFDDSVYTLPSGEKVIFDNLQFFISDVNLTDNEGVRKPFAPQSNRIHYVDSDIPATQTWAPEETFPIGVYEYADFIFGLDESRNLSYIFSNPPEANMGWPEALGGGYHYMKLNGYWCSAEEEKPYKPFGFHSGIGKVAEGVFEQNYVQAGDSLLLFLSRNNSQTLTIHIDIAEFFDNPHRWRFADFEGMSIMGSREAQTIIRENVASAFSVTQ